MTYKTVKTIATIGPASEGDHIIKKLMDRGVGIFRLNLSHGDLRWHKDVIDRIKDLGKKTKKNVVIALDLPGPKFRIGKLPNGNLDVKYGRDYTIGAGGDIPVSKAILDSLSTSKIIKLSDGKLELNPIKMDGKLIVVKAMNSYKLLSKQSINQNGINYPSRYPTKEDIKGIRFGLTNGIDTFALSFISCLKDVEKVRNVAGKDSVLISKIERKEGVDNFKEIAEASDIVMVARGDLGLNMDISNVPKLQEKLIFESHQLKKPVIVATQMLESMVNSSIPTRAEADDVFTAVEEGADSLMLSEETAIGDYPVKSAKTLIHLIDTFKSGTIMKSAYTIKSEDDALADAAIKLAESTGIKDMIIMTIDGASAFRLSRYFGSDIRLFALTTRSSTFEKLAFGRGIEPSLYRDLDYGLKEVKGRLKTKLRARKAILVAGAFGKVGSTTKIEILDL